MSPSGPPSRAVAVAVIVSVTVAVAFGAGAALAHVEPSVYDATGDGDVWMPDDADIGVVGSPVFDVTGYHFDQYEYEVAAGSGVEAELLATADGGDRRVTVHRVTDGAVDDEPVATLDLRDADDDGGLRFRIDTRAAGENAVLASSGTEVDAAVSGNASFVPGEYEIRSPGSWAAALTIERSDASEPDGIHEPAGTETEGAEVETGDHPIRASRVG